MSRNFRPLVSVVAWLIIGGASLPANAMMFDTGGGHAEAGLLGLATLLAMQLGIAVASQSLGRKILLRGLLGFWIFQIAFLMVMYPIAFFYSRQVLLGLAGFACALWVGLKSPRRQVKLWMSLAVSASAWLLSILLTRSIAAKIGIGNPHAVESDIEVWKLWLGVIAAHGLVIVYYIYRASVATRARAS
jgi:hypothetical protein